eukprot:1136789-Pelagomonas_calceolata.AAC.14
MAEITIKHQQLGRFAPFLSQSKHTYTEPHTPCAPECRHPYPSTPPLSPKRCYWEAALQQCHPRQKYHFPQLCVQRDHRSHWDDGRAFGVQEAVHLGKHRHSVDIAARKHSIDTAAGELIQEHSIHTEARALTQKKNIDTEAAVWSMGRRKLCTQGEAGTEC